MATVTDQMGRTIDPPANPQRIISLVPSQTELLFDLGLDREIVGVTKFCVHPGDKVRAKQRVGGTKQLKLDAIHRLQPDLIIGNKEENERKDILQLAESYSVWLSDIVTLSDALDMIRQVGRLVDRRDAADSLAVRIDHAFAGLRPLMPRRRVGYFIWRKPFMVAGRETFINDMLDRCGLENAFADRDGRYPEVTIEEVTAAELDAILLSSEPFPFREQHRADLARQVLNVEVRIVDGEMMSWYGSRLRLAPDYMRGLVRDLEQGVVDSES